MSAWLDQNLDGVLLATIFAVLGVVALAVALVVEAWVEGRGE